MLFLHIYDTKDFTPFRFLFRTLSEQFRKVANLYFLLLIILMIVGTYTTLFDSPLSPLSTGIVLSIVISVSMIKSGYEGTMISNL